MAQPHVAMFSFTLGANNSIGPAELRELWARASGVSAVHVGRRLQPYGDERPTYTLYGPQSLTGVHEVGRRLCALLEARHLNARVVTLCGTAGV
ncbi:hypothetical protein [Pseudoxanthomonas winnipegensis]|jgi:hypothetical protein|uniref:Uncharacterized protein n=1 Tax=Pseudoxanthomonas winnipegensis TaxID=2480810 RepID=A0A4Q8LBU7_9GAMM|nr:hypothetical protein [Pseudoxanthomonas winnipegensis]TAA25819.1 hypothetical protein EA660_10345 [Pseudoxanthomonas winnipegensis]